MSPKLSVDDSLVFLYTCLKHKNGDNIDFAAVGAEIGNLKPGAAHMRFYRLRNAIEAKKDASEHGDNMSKKGTVPGPHSSAAKSNGKMRAVADGSSGKKRKADVADIAAKEEHVTDKKVKAELDIEA